MKFRFILTDKVPLRYYNTKIFNLIFYLNKKLLWIAKIINYSFLNLFQSQ